MVFILGKILLEEQKQILKILHGKEFYYSKIIFDTIYNYGKIGEGSLPLFHILNAYLNPFTYNEKSFQLSICAISFLNVIFFSQILKQKYKIKIIDSYLYSSIFLILPFFRSSAFWGLTENLGWLFLILTIKFYLVVYKNKVNIFLSVYFQV